MAIRTARCFKVDESFTFTPYDFSAVIFLTRQNGEGQAVNIFAAVRNDAGAHSFLLLISVCGLRAVFVCALA